MNFETLFAPWLIWFLAGIALAFLELQLPGFIVLFFGFGCWAAAAAVLLWDLTLTGQIVVFLAASIASLLLLRRFLMKIFRGSAADRAGDGLADFPAGQQAKVLKTVSPEAGGRILFRGTHWDAVAAETIEAGETVELLRHADDSRMVFFVRKPQVPKQGVSS